MNSINPRNCKYCHKDLIGKHFNAVFCDEICGTNFKIKNKVAKSHQVFNMNNKNEWVECPCCSFRSRQLSHAHLKLHGFNTIKEFKEQYKEAETLSESLKSEMSSRVAGDKNPAYQHGGRLSPFSKKFVKYQEKTEEEISIRILELAKQLVNTRDANQNNTLTVEYYIKRGASLEEAGLLLQDRQSTFSLERCICNFGEEQGTKVWQDRQKVWQNTLNSKSEEEKQAINKKKSTKVNYRSLWNASLTDDGYFYIIRVEDRTFKIGITTKSSIESRYSKTDLKGKTVILFEKCEDINHAFQVEQILKKKYIKNISKIFESIRSPFGWTETIRGDCLDELLEYSKRMLIDPDKSAAVFMSTVKLKNETF